MNEITTPRHWPALLAWAGVAALVWLLEVVWQVEGRGASLTGSGIIRGSALAGTTLISCALLLSVVFTWKPSTAKYWRIRRYLGVSGFVAVALHVLFVYVKLYDMSLRDIYFTFHPFDNPIVFGSVAFLIITIMAATSSDLMMRVVHPRNWKRIHRCVYIAYPLLVAHFFLMSPRIYKDPAGMALCIVVALTLLLRLAKFITDIASQKIRGIHKVVGVLIFLGSIALGIAVFSN